MVIYRNLEKFVQDNCFITNTCLEVWDEGVAEELDTASCVYYAGRDENGSIFSDHQIVLDEQVYEDEMAVFNRAYETGEPCWSQPYLDKYLSHAYVVTCYKKCELPGVMLSADVKLTTLLQNIDSLQFYDNSKMYIVSSHGRMYSLDDGKINQTDIIDFDPDRQMKISAHYQNLDIDIINIVPKDEIYSTVWHGIFMVFIVCIVGLTIIALLVHRSFTRAQQRLAETIEKANQEEMTLKRLENELAIAARIQKQMLTQPDVGVHLVPDLGSPVDIMSKIIPAREVGGDLYEYRMEGHNLVFCVGDVSGKGIPASVIMTKCCTLFHAYVSATDDPDSADLLRYLNIQLCRENETAMFVTMWVGVLDMRDGTLHYSSAGHNSPVLLPYGQSVQELQAVQGTPLGLFDDTKYQAAHCQLQVGSALLLYTDGITEAEDSGHNLFGTDRLLQACHFLSEPSALGSAAGLVQEPSTLSPVIVCDTVLRTVSEHIKGYIQSDDITLLCLTFAGHYAQMQGIHDIKALHALTEEMGASYRATLALEELAVNAFTYGGASFVSIEALTPETFIITDNGAVFDPTAYVAPAKFDNQLSIGGRGISLVRAVSSEFTYRRTRNAYNKTIIKIKEEIPS